MATLKQINNATLKALNESEEITTIDIRRDFFNAFKTLKIDYNVIEITVEFLGPQSIRGDKETISVTVPWTESDDIQNDIFYGIIQWIKRAFAKKYPQYKNIEVFDQDAKPEKTIIEELKDNSRRIQRIITLYGVDSSGKEQEIGAFSIIKKVK